MEEIKDFIVDVGDDNLVVSLSDTSEKISLRGVVVEHGFSVPAIGTLWLTSDDSPYEETLHISLVDKDLKLVEQVELYKPYTPGVLKDVVAKDNLIQFEFWQGVFHQVTIENQKKLRFSRFFPQAGCHYSNKFEASYLTISK
ncbi:hypothetical protein [Agarivorans sp. JK6]|uniref:hypothetical protein n=1 Tax=Agarivorans sp. JK6 TaxID=2997426 RepID=UPI003873B4EC